MMQRIDLFMPPMSAYGVLHHFTRKMHEALMRCGVKARLLTAQTADPTSFLQELLDFFRNSLCLRKWEIFLTLLFFWFFFSIPAI